jgi:hypothetical protein
MRSPLVCLTLASWFAAFPAAGQTLSQLAKQQGCTSTPVVVEGTALYKCQTQSAMSYFSGPPPATSAPAPATTTTTTAARKNGVPVARAPAPANFPRVDQTTQRERDDVRKRVLTEELATEVRMMAESDLLLKQGSTPLPNETVTSPKYIDRVAKLKQAVDNHAKNIQALNRELERVR